MGLSALTEPNDRHYCLDGMPPVTGGPGALTLAGPVLRDLIGAGAAAIIVADPGLAEFGYAERLSNALSETGLYPSVFTGFTTDPSFDAADAAADRARRDGVAAVVGLGGGSAVDLAKAVAAGCAANGSVSRFALGAGDMPAETLPIVAIPTTAGTGSETTRTAVLSDRAGVKHWIWGQVLKPRHVVLDPELTVGLPPSLTAATGLDALVHAIEAATNKNATMANTAIALTAIRLVVGHLPAAVETPSDLTARTGMQLAAAYAGLAIDNAGTAMAHAIGHALSSLDKVHHGAAVAAAMSSTLDWIVADDDGRFGRIAEAMGGPCDAAALPSLFEGLARRVGHSFDLAIGPALTPSALAAQIRKPENVPMLDATWRVASDDDLLRFARRVLSPRQTL